MNKKTFIKICFEKKLNPQEIEFNLGYNVENIKLYKGRIYKPCMFSSGKPVYQYNERFEIKLEDCV